VSKEGNEASGSDEPTRALFRSIALERQGYYDSAPGGPPRLSFWQRRIRRIVHGILDPRVASDPACRRVLDAGCGRGDFTLALASRYPGLEDVVGCDFSPELLELARAAAEGQPNVRFVAGDLIALPLGEQSVDVTVCLNVLHHVRPEQFASALAELARVTRTTLVIEIKNARSPYFRMHSRRVEGLAIFPVAVAQVTDRLRALGFELIRPHAIFGIEWLSPLVVLQFERRPSMKPQPFGA
jgi:SAM-dependent methyltransferase